MLDITGSVKASMRVATAIVLGAILSACQPYGASRSDVLSAGRVAAADGQPASEIEVVRVDASSVSRIKPLAPVVPFANALADVLPVGTVVGVGDALQVSIWEAPPATLFGGSMPGSRLGGFDTSSSTALPEVLVGPEGQIAVPFAGQVPAAGRTLKQIEQDVVARLRGRANSPQVLVRLVRNATSNVTVVGDVRQTVRMPLTPRGERLLDALASAGGATPPVNLATVQLTRDGRSYRMPLADILERAENNVMLARDDVVAVLYQPYSFTVLGAAGRNEEVRFEAMGITMAQALSRAGGLQDGRSDPRGVFVFRWEDSEIAGEAVKPVIYSFDLKDPAVFFLIQQFPMRDRDLVYITNSPVAELQRFVNIVASTILPVATVTTVIQNQ